mgnify:CR=1 FL=1
MFRMHAVLVSVLATSCLAESPAKPKVEKSRAVDQTGLGPSYKVFRSLEGDFEISLPGSPPRKEEEKSGVSAIEYQSGEKGLSQVVTVFRERKGGTIPLASLAEDTKTLLGNPPLKRSRLFGHEALELEGLASSEQTPGKQLRVAMTLLSVPPDLVYSFMSFGPTTQTHAAWVATFRLLKP